LVFIHRWLGVALCVLFLLWFPSAIGIMYWDYPTVTRADRLERSPALDRSKVVLGPGRALASVGAVEANQLRLNSSDGRPVYRFRDRGEEVIVYADTGERQVDVSKDMMLRVASAWTGEPPGAATVEAVGEVDQWTLQLYSRSGRLRKYSWPSGEQVYLSEGSGEVVQSTTTASRIGAYLGPIPHWFYFTPLRKHGAEWTRVIVWSSGIATAAAILGIIVGLWMYSPSKRYRNAGAPTAIPYRGQKRLHMIFGLIFGVAVATWAFSGLLSVEPFPSWTTGRGSDVGIADALLGEADPGAFAGTHPRTALEALEGLDVKELEWTSIAGEAVYLARLANRDTRIVPVRGGAARREYDRQRLIDVITAGAQPYGLADIRVIEKYDAYYLNRRGLLPLPVIRAIVNDADRSRFYIDPKTGRIVGSYNASTWVTRWVYHGLHSFDFPWLYNYRPAWDIVVLTFMLGGTALSVTSLILAWRVLGRTLSGAFASSSDRAAATASDDLAIG
jgi:hypothetical protein